MLIIAQDNNGHIGIQEPAQYEFEGTDEFGRGGNGVWRAGKGMVLLV